MEGVTLKEPGRTDRRDVRTAVAVEVARRKKIGESRRKVLSRLKRPIPIPQQHRYSARIPYPTPREAAHHLKDADPQILDSIPVEIGDGEGARLRIDTDKAVAVELTDHKGLGTQCGGTDIHFSKSTLPVTEKYRDLAGRMAHSQICTSIAVEVAYRDTSMVFAAQGGASAASEAPISVVQQDRYAGFCKPISHRQIGKNIVIEKAHANGTGQEVNWESPCGKNVPSPRPKKRTPPPRLVGVAR